MTDNYSRAIKFLQSGQPDMALTLLMREHINNPTNQEVIYHIAFSYRMIGDYQNAIKFYKQGIEINRNFYSAYYGLGIVYQLKGDYDKAIEILKKAIEIELRCH